MKASVGKPVLAMVSVACIAVPAATGVASAATTTPSHSSAQIVPTAATAAISQTELLKLLTFPYHNVLGIGIGVGTAANAGLNLVLLPVSIASFVAVNQTDKIPAYVQTVQTNLENAFPTIIKSIQAEVAYDQNLFSSLGATPATQARPSAADVSAVMAGAVDPNTLLKILTFPYHNALGIAIGFGTAANAVLNLALLPVTIASLIAVNQTDDIPAQVQRIETGVANAIPGIIKSIQNEINYDKNLFSSIGIAAAKAPVAKALEAAPAAKTAAGIDAGTTKTPATGADAQDSDATGTHETKTGTKTGKGEASAENTGNETKPTDSTPAKDAPADSTPAKDATPAKDGKPGKTGGVHQGVTGTTGTTNTGGAAKPAKSGPSKTDGTHHQNAGAGKHTAGTAGHSGHSAK
jgi:hypothetical protein